MPLEENTPHMSRVRTHLTLLPLSLALLLAFFLPAPVSGAIQPPTPIADLDDVQALEDFFDGLAAAQRDAYPVAGMTISVVKDGELLFAKGYGYADVENQIPVDADETLFRPGSVSKLFVWTAMMQQVEAGTLDLDTDVNEYLDFQIPNTFEQPITLRHLMTHTPGFEDQGLGLYVRSADERAPLGDYLAQNIPARVFPPGEIIAYSNYGASLAAYIVERVTEMPFYEYVEQHIFQPLGMEDSTFRQPVPPELMSDLSGGYQYQQGRFEKRNFEVIQSYPAGSLSSTATDLARFMIAHLQDGRFGETRILQEQTARQMKEMAFAHDPRLPGWGTGFSVAERDGLRLVGHGGDTSYFHSELAMLPDEGVGLFVSTNTDRGTFARFHFMEAFLERYFVEVAPERPQPPSDFAQRADAYAGAYYPARMNFSSIEKILSLLQPAQVQPTEDGLLRVTGVLGPTPTYWVERAPNVFSPVGGELPASATLMFEEGETGDQIEYLYFEQSAYIKQPLYASPAFNYALLGLSVLFFVTMVIAVPTATLTHRRYRQTAPQQIPAHPRGARTARWLAWLLALFNLIFLIGFFITVSDLNNVIFGLPPTLEALLLVPWLSAVLSFIVVVFAVLAWLRHYWTLWGRVFYTLFALTTLAYLWFLRFWNFL